MENRSGLENGLRRLLGNKIDEDALRSLLVDRYDEEKKAYEAMLNAWKNEYVNTEDEIQFISETHYKEHAKAGYTRNAIKDTEYYSVVEEKTDEEKLLVYCKRCDEAAAHELVYVGIDVNDNNKHTYRCPYCNSIFIMDEKYDNVSATDYRKFNKSYGQ